MKKYQITFALLIAITGGLLWALLLTVSAYEKQSPQVDTYPYYGADTLHSEIYTANSSIKSTKQPSAIKLRYWEYITEFTLGGGCQSSSKGLCYTKGGALSYDWIKWSTEKWVYPDKIIKFRLIELREIKKSELIDRDEKFECRQWGSIIDTDFIIDTLHSEIKRVKLGEDDIR